MNQNRAAVSALREYVRIANPKYAFMIEAPWGSGKTHLVKHEFQQDLRKGDARYITLNGVRDRTTFRRALLAETDEASLTQMAGEIGNTLGQLGKLGNIGSILQNAVEDRMINKLPDLLIFDDVERCEMSPAEILGILNDFVEHQEKKVVLCGFIERNEGFDDEKKKRELFLTLKEKVVGRTVRIVADIEQALPALIDPMPDGHGKNWFKLNHEMVREVFSEAEHSNLRVLRQCLHDCGRVIDVLDEDLRVSADAMLRFVRTYLVLSMALVTGKLTSPQLSERREYKCVVKPAEGKDPHPLYDCQAAHPHAEIFSGNSASILPNDLGVSLIGVGYEVPETINRELRATKQFSGETTIPLWRRFVEWRGLPTGVLVNTHNEVLSFVLEAEEIEPGPYLHMAHDLISIAEEGEGSGREIAKKIHERIKLLSKLGKIPAATFGTEYGWSIERGFSYGGYAFDPDELVKPLILAMREFQLLAFEKLRDGEATRIMHLLRSGLEEFEKEFSWQGNHGSYYKTEILHMIDPKEFASVIFGHITSGNFKATGTLLRNLADRHRNSGDFSHEIAWASKMRASLIEIAENVGPLEKARMRWFLGYSWKFSAEVKKKPRSKPRSVANPDQ